MTRAIIRHGTRNTYERHKCRCDECRAANAARHHAWVIGNRDRHRELANESYARHRDVHIERKRATYDPVKNAARMKVRDALCSGALVRGSCEVSDGSCSGDVQAHHDDYSRPLVVRWLCRRHHRLHHLEVSA